MTKKSIEEVKFEEAGKDGTMAGFNKFTKEAKEQTNENN